jgi:hypothetical protein
VAEETYPLSTIPCYDLTHPPPYKNAIVPDFLDEKYKTTIDI